MSKATLVRGFAACVAALSLLAAAAGTAEAQLTPAEEQLKVLTDPESVKSKVDKEKTRPPLEMFRSQVAPFDVLPYVKANHWSTMSMELRANYADYDGTLQTTPVRLAGLPMEVIFRRDARLPKTQRSRLGLQLFLPEIPREIAVELNRADSVRADEIWQAALRPLERQQMLILFLSKESNDAFALWNRYQALYPHGLERADAQAADKRRYYRLVLPLEPDKPPVSSHPLTWTTLSHVVWDGVSPEILSPSQQEAMLDWLHWGGQLVLIGGPGPSFSLLKDSFLSPFLPADVTGENLLLARADLAPLAAEYRPPFLTRGSTGEGEMSAYDAEPVMSLGNRYRGAAQINPPEKRPVYLAGLTPRPGAQAIPLGESGTRLVGVEQRVGRGRILMLALNPTDPALATWPGLDTFVRRVVLRRPEESRASRAAWTGAGFAPPRFGPLPAPDLSWVRFLSRDITVPLPVTKTAETPRPTDAGPRTVRPPTAFPRGLRPTAEVVEDYTVWAPDTSVAEWNDRASLPRFCRGLLESASGIKVPKAGFVLKVLIAYILAIVPLNWLLCRYVFNRREWAWAIVPVLSIGFAVGVERAAAYDLGFDSACDEIDILETFGGHPHAHVSRFGSLYSTGRTRFTVSFPNDPTALALPLDNGRSLRGEDVSTSVWKSYPVPALESYLIQPRSLGLFRAEHMSGFGGTVSLETDDDSGGQTLVNASGLELRDAVVVDYAGPGDRKETYLGTVAAGGRVDLRQARSAPRPPGRDRSVADPLDPERLLKPIREYYEDRPENAGEIRLVAWAEKPFGGDAVEKIEPPVDRHRGYTAVVVHLKCGPAPSPDGPIYDSRASAPPAGPNPSAPRPTTTGGNANGKELPRK